MSTGEFPTVASALLDRADHEDALARHHQELARIWRRAAELAAEGGEAARRVTRVATAGLVLPQDPEGLELVLGIISLEDCRRRRRSGQPSDPAALYEAAFKTSAEVARAQALARAGRAAGSGSP